MKIFQLETPVLKKIKSFVDKSITDGNIPANQKIEYLDYEPDEGFLHSDLDGAVAVFGSSIGFDPSNGSNTEQQENESMLTVVSYGFGDPVPENTDVDSFIYSTVREAQIRAQALITLAYGAIMDRREIQGSPSENIEKAFGSGVDFGADKFPVSLQKFSPMGTMSTRSGVCIYKMIFKFRLEEVTMQEALGVSYAGSDNLDSETYNPGSEPE